MSSLKLPEIRSPSAQGLPLAVAAAIAPILSRPLTHLGLAVTPGRLLAPVSVGCAIWAWRVAAGDRTLVPIAARCLLGAWTLLASWVAINAATAGCGCASSVLEVVEIVAFGWAATILVLAAPHATRLLFLGSLVGIVLTALLALADVGTVSGSAGATPGRASSPYGNANEVGYALSFGFPMCLALLVEAHRRIRLAAGGALVLMAVPLVMTYSRGGLIAAGAGSLVLLAMHARREWGSRSRRIAVVALAASVGAIGAAYPAFIQARINSSLPAPDPVYKAQDLGGWDGAADRLPSRAPRLSNVSGGTVLRIGTDRPGEGVSYPLAAPATGTAYKIDFHARAQGRPTVFSFAVGANPSGAGTPPKTVALRSRWRSFTVQWRPSRTVRDARAYFWQNSGRTTFQLRKVAITAEQAGRAVQRQVPMQLQGSTYSRDMRRRTAAEDRYLQSRLDAAELAATAFVGSPLTGIGWDTFPAYADAHLSYGRLATHNELLRIAAELGLIGLAALALGIYAIARASHEARPGPRRDLLLALVVTGVVNQLFANGIVFAEASLPFVFALASLAAFAQQPTKPA